MNCSCLIYQALGIVSYGDKSPNYKIGEPPKIHGYCSCLIYQALVTQITTDPDRNATLKFDERRITDEIVEGRQSEYFIPNRMMLFLNK